MQKSSRIMGLVIMLLGFMSLIKDLGQPRVQMLHGADTSWVSRATGHAWGCGIVGLLERVRLPEK
jgi:hypothetical protein